MERREFLKYLLASGVAVGSGFGGMLSGCQQENTNVSLDHTNVLLIVVDTLRADYLGCYGNNAISTPAIDQLASEGVFFENSFSQSSTTNPSHASLFTGLYLKNHGVVDNLTRLPAIPATMAEILRAQGYETAAAVGGFHLNSEYSGFGRGFDEYFDVRSPPDHNNSEFIFLTRRAKETNKEVFRWLKAHRNDPFFMWVHYFDVHTPYKPPKPYNTLYYSGDPTDQRHHSMDQAVFPKNTPNPPKWLRGVRDLEYVRSQYMGEITYTDKQIGNLLSYLKRLGLEENTLVVLTSDHGEGFGEHGLYFRHWGLYDEVLRVPFVMRCPQLISPQKTVSTLSSAVDIVPTILEFLDVDFDPRDFDGQSLCSVIGGEHEPVYDRHIYSENTQNVAVSVRNEKWLAIKDLKTLEHTAKCKHIKDRLQLYDYVDDQQALVENSLAHPDIVAGFEKELAAWLNKKRTLRTGPVDRHAGEDIKEKLRALGYVE